MGANSLFGNTTGSGNTAIGRIAMFNNTTGVFNTALGYGTLHYNKTGEYNTATGYHALQGNNTGSYNTATGTRALYKNTSGTYNTATGATALHNNSAGNYNAAYGNGALYSNTTGSYNTSYGYNALYDVTVGSYNTAIGALTNPNPFAGGYVSNTIAIGSHAWVYYNNSAVIGNGAVTSIGGAVSWTTFSDGRFKRNIRENIIGLDFVNSLRPISYTVDVSAVEKYKSAGRSSLDDSANENDRAIMNKSIEDAGKIVYEGFVAQEVEAAAGKLNFTFSGVDKPATPEGLYGLRYDHFVVPLVKAVQELSRLNEEKDKRLDSIQKQLHELRALLMENKNNLSGKGTPDAVSSASASPSSGQTILLTSATLEQNIPNPFSNTTTIPYTLPEKYATAHIVVSDGSGKSIKRIAISGSGKGVLHIEAPSLAAGAYQYSLVIDGKLIATRQMILAR